MVNFQDPAIVALDFLTVVKLWHTVDGLYIWEFVTTLDYEWSVFCRRRQYLRTIWIYSLTRVATLLAVIVNMIGFDPTRPIHCQAWIAFEVAFAYLGVASATLLVALRTVAIWDRNKIVVMVVMGIWLTNLSFLIYSVVQLRASWAPAQGTCAPLKTDSGRHNILATLSTDVILLLIMLFGLSHLRRRLGGTSSLVRLLWTQGIIWLLLAIVAEVPPTVAIFLDLNVPFNLMFQTPALITVSISATRMYRSLTNFHPSDISQDGTQRHMVVGTNCKRIFAGPIQLDRMEVAVHTHFEQYPDSQLQGSSRDGRLYDKPHGVAIDGDVESGGDSG